MKIAVLVKQTFDTEEKLVLEDQAISEKNVKFIVNPYDEYAIEEAIQLRDQFGGEIIAVSVGQDRATDALRTALAMGADEAVLICDERLNDADEVMIAEALACELRKHDVDIVIGGNFSVDSGGGQVAIRVAELLEIPHVGSITKLEINDRLATTHRDAEGDIEIVQVALPALFTAQQGLNEPRYPSLPGIMKAKKKPLKVNNLDELGLVAGESATSRVSLNLPPERGECQILNGDLQKQVLELTQLLRDQKKVI